MPKRFEDVIPKRTVRIQPKVWEQPRIREPEPEPEEEEVVVRPKIKIKKTPPPRRVVEEVSEKPPRKHRLWIIALVAIVFFAFALSFVFAKAFITIEPRTAEAEVKGTISAVKDTNSTSPSFDLVIISGSETMEVEAGAESDVSVSAKGKVILYNNFSTASQKLSIDTRLEGSNGKIYKTVKEVTIPGMKGTTPGSLEVDVYASAAGDSYNVGPQDYTIVGFKGTNKYDKFYGRGKGNITGGMVGKFPVISAEDKNSAVIGLKAALETSLIKKITNQIPEGFVMFKEAAVLNVTNEKVDYDKKDGNMVPVTLEGTLYGFLFNEEKLSKYMAEKYVSDYDGEDVYISNLKNLTFNLPNKETMSFGDVKKIDFSLTGDAKFVWRLNQEEFMDDILGKSKSDFNEILSKYTNVESADLRIRPFWKMSFPDKEEGVEMQINYPN